MRGIQTLPKTPLHSRSLTLSLQDPPILGCQHPQTHCCPEACPAVRSIDVGDFAFAQCSCMPLCFLPVMQCSGCPLQRVVQALRSSLSVAVYIPKTACMLVLQRGCPWRSGAPVFQVVGLFQGWHADACTQQGLHDASTTHASKASTRAS